MRPTIQTRAGWAMTILFALFMLAASIAPKLLRLGVAREALAMAGWDDRHLLLSGFIELLCLLLYLFPRISMLGAVMITGLLGGAIASHLRAGNSAPISASSCGADFGCGTGR